MTLTVECLRGSVDVPEQYAARLEFLAGDGARGERDGRREGASGGGHGDQVDDGNGVLSTQIGRAHV